MRILLFLQLFLTISSISYGQVLTGTDALKYHPSADEVRFDSRSTAPLFIAFREGSFVSSSSGMEALRSALGCGAYDTWQLQRTDADELGISHQRFQQHYRLVRVVTGEYIVHSHQGRILSANGIFHKLDGINTSPVLSESAALSAATRHLAAEKYLWQASGEEQQILYGGNAYPKGELVILPALGYEKEQANALCWSFDIYTTAPLGRWQIYIDARTGKVVFKENRICSVNVNGTAVTKYSGTQVMQVDSIAASSFRLRDASRGGGVQTYNLLNGTSYAGAVDFTDTDNYWNTTTNQDNAAYDAHWGTQRTYDYFQSVHGRNSYDNAGATLKSYVHYSTSYNNAFWNGSVMTYGDGDGSTFSPLTELDIIAHELTHGVTDFSSNLVYSYESGALNESFSDIFGVTVDFYARPAQGSFTVGDQSYTPNTAGDGLRFMQNPNAAGDPDTYQGTYWYTGTGDNGGVHYNSGVQNFWYYLLCQGGSGTNDKGFAYNVTGIGMNKARMIAYRNNNFYLTSSSKYADAAFYALKSANDLYGNCSPEAVAVKNAWDAVGVYGLSLNLNATAAVSGAACLGSTLQLSASGGISYSWTGPNGFSSSLQNPSIPNAGTANNGTYTCVVTDAGGCSGAPTVTVNLVPGPSVSVSGAGSICTGGSLQLTANASIPGAGGNNGTNSTAVAIPDNNTTGVSSSINISGSTNASSIIAVTIDSLTHTWDADLIIELVAPNGSVITLANGVGGSGDNFIRTRFQSTGTAISAGTAPFTGNYVPQQAFSLLTGSANGTWRLRVKDTYSQDVGTLWKWSIALPANTITSYSWSPATGLSSATVSNPTAGPAVTTNYTVTVSSSGGCSSTATALVSVGGLTATVQKTNATCSGSANGSATVNVSGASGSVSYLWSNGATTAVVSGLAAGSYSYTVTDPASCTATGSVTISAPSALSGAVTTLDASCGLSNGTATASVSGGVTPYSYNWSSGATTAAATGLGAGTYSVTVTDANGCTLPISGIAIAANGLQSGISKTDVSCSGLDNGTAGVTVTGGTGSISYSWSNGATTASVSGLAAGTYTCTIADQGGCSSVLTAVISSPAPLSATGSVQNATCGIINGAVTLSVTGGTAPYTFLWSTGATTQNISSLAGGTYTVSVSDSRGCTTNQIFTVIATTLPSTPGPISGPATEVCAGSVKNYSISPVTGATGYTWTVPTGAVVSSGQGTSSVNVTFPAGFTTGSVAVRANNSCGSSNTVSLSVRSVPLTQPSISGPISAVCNSTVTYTTPASTSGATSYNWTSSSGTQIISGQGTTGVQIRWPATSTSSGSVCVTAVNACGSSTSRCLSNITTLPLKPASITGPALVCRNQASVAYSVTGQAGVTYTWTVPTGATITSGQGTPGIVVTFGTRSGNIGVRASNGCGTTNSTTLKVSFNCREGLNLEEALTIYPNPSSGIAHLRFDGDPGRYTVSVFDILGKLVQRDSSNLEQYPLNLTLQPHGIYLISVDMADGSRKVLRFVFGN